MALKTNLISSTWWLGNLRENKGESSIFLSQLEVCYVTDCVIWVSAHLEGWVTELGDSKQMFKRHCGFKLPILLVAGEHVRIAVRIGEMAWWEVWCPPWDLKQEIVGHWCGYQTQGLMGERTKWGWFLVWEARKFMVTLFFFSNFSPLSKEEFLWIGPVLGQVVTV